MARGKRDAPAAEPAAIVVEAATSRGVVALSPGESLAYRMHQTADLAARLNMLEAVTDEEVLLDAEALLRGDGARELAVEVVERVSVLRRARAEAAGVDVEVDEAPCGLLWEGEQQLLTPLSPVEHATAREDAIAASQRLLDAESEEKERAALAREKIADLRVLHKDAQRIAHTGEDYRPQRVERVVRGGRVELRRLDTGTVIEEREATASEIERASQVKLWGGR